MFSPNDFLLHFSKHNDFAKAARFNVEISRPAGWIAGSTNFADLRFQCESAEIPGYNINVVDAKIYGVPLPVASFSSFNDLTLTFICAGDLWEKRLFDDWMNLIAPINNYEMNYKDRYVSKINVKQYYEYDKNPSYVASFWNAFPISMTPLTLNWGDDAIHKLSVTFKYDYWSTNRTEGFSLDRQLGNRPAEPSISTIPLPSGAGPISVRPGITGPVITGPFAAGTRPPGT